MEIRQLTKDDIVRIELGEMFRPMFELYLDMYGKYAWMIEDGDSPVAAFGCNFIYGEFGGVAEAWIKIFNKVKAKSIVKTARLKIAETVDHCEIHRLQAVSRADEPYAVRFNEFMGFVKEGVLKRYFPDRVDGIMMRYEGKKCT